jgi:hypothetical protein
MPLVEEVFRLSGLPTYTFVEPVGRGYLWAGSGLSSRSPPRIRIEPGGTISANIQVGSACHYE